MNVHDRPAAQDEGALPQWKQIAKRHRQHQLSQIPPEWILQCIPSPVEERNAVAIVTKHLSMQEQEITSLDQSLPRLQEAIRTKTYSAYQVTSAFCHRAAILQQLTGCLTEILFSRALSKAREQDDLFTSTGTLVGPLHGIPVSIKDNQDIEGVDSTLGWVGLINQPASSSTPVVEGLVSAGAILYCKTNIPQSMMMSDSYNHVYGQSVNSLNRNLISGGSSGGEAALIAAGGSIAGIGTDIGGSVRIPAVLQGLYGLSPSIGRIGNRESTRRDKYVVPPVAGPLSRDLSTLSTFMSAYLSQSPWLTDPAVLPIPWRSDLTTKYSSPSATSLKVGFITDDGVIKPQPPITRAMHTTIAHLRRAGHQLIDFTSTAKSLHSRAYSLWLRAVLADGGSRFHSLCAIVSEPLIPGMLVGKDSNTLDVAGRMALYDEIYAFQREYMRVWNGAGLDCLVMPVTQWVGLRPKMWVQADMYVGYTSIWNLMNWTALAVSTGVEVEREKDEADEEWKAHVPRSFSDRYNWEKYEELFEEFVGMPVGVQIVTGRLEEEKAVGIAMQLEELRKGV